MSTLRPRTPKSITTLQDRIQHQWENLQHWSLDSPVFVQLLYMVVFGLDPSQADLLEAGNDLSYLFDPHQSLPKERYAILLHLYRMATTAADEAVLALPSVASRMEVWSAFHQSVFGKLPPLTTPHFASVKAGDMKSFLGRIGRPMDLSKVRYWMGRLWHTLPFEPPWYFPSTTDLTLDQEGEVTMAVGVLQGILEQDASEPAFDPEFLTPIALSRFSWSSSKLNKWSQTARAAEIALTANHRI